ncbi:hypothetical protein MMC10_000855 [Thelotrema lepadinum]|nr:hypothetical protein [Thelotrema lepadinum]
MASTLTAAELSMPLVPNPDGSPPNYIDPPTLAPAVTGVGVSLTIATTLLVVMRISTNARTAKGLGIDDVFCVIALLLAIPFTGVQLSMNDTARHAWDVPLSAINDPAYLKKTFVVSVFIGPVFFFSKSTILLFYFYVFKPKKWLRVAVWCALVVLFIIYSAMVPAAFVLCMPSRGEDWNLSAFTKCALLEPWAKALGVANVLADLYIIILPLPIILRLHQAVRTRLAIAAMFGTGVFGLVASTMSLYYRVTEVPDLDSSWVATETHICVITEAYVAILVCCMPFLPLFWKKLVVTTSLYSSARSVLRSRKPIRSPTLLHQQREDVETTSRSSSEPILELQQPPKLALRGNDGLYHLASPTPSNVRTIRSPGSMKSVTPDMAESWI